MFGCGSFVFVFFREFHSSPDPELWWHEKEGARLPRLIAKTSKNVLFFSFIKRFLQQGSESLHGKVRPDGRPKHTSAVVASRETVEKTAVTS